MIGQLYRVAAAGALACALLAGIGLAQDAGNGFEGLALVSVERADTYGEARTMAVSPDASKLTWSVFGGHLFGIPSILRRLCARRPRGFGAERRACTGRQTAGTWRLLKTYSACLSIRISGCLIRIRWRSLTALMTGQQISWTTATWARPHVVPTWDPSTGDLYFFLETVFTDRIVNQLLKIDADDLFGDSEPRDHPRFLVRAE